VDSHWQTAVDAHIFSTPGEILVAGLESAPVPGDLVASGATLLALPAGNNGVDLTALMNELGKRQLNELHSECGPGLAGALIEQGLVDEMLIYVAPKLMGSDAQGMFAMAGITQMSAVKKLNFRDICQVGDDLRIIAEPCRE
jgi:diaminohydroxyphosphoribosylaminopyrimidine deaminase/5-amino-6-(5-phosphoribosylamino)uracil reductase